MCRPLSRREMLRFTAMAAATPLAARIHRPVRAFAQVLSTAAPMNLELVTLTETSAVLTWFTGDPTKVDDYARPAPIPADTVFELGTSPTSLQRIVERHDETPYHYVELTGLEPGRTYWYRASSNGIPATPTVIPGDTTVPGRFTTPQPPPGRHLFTMAWCNDLHLGEMSSGQAFQGFPPGYAVDPANPYWKVMFTASATEARERGANLMLVNGDLTSEAEPANLALARSILDGFGRYREDYWVTRGNHDRAHSGSTWASCQPVGGGYEDCLRDEFFPDGRTFFSFDARGVHFVGLDTNDLTTGSGAFPAEQAEWLVADLKAHSGTPTFVFGHHPVSEEGRATTIGSGPSFSLSQPDAQRIEQAVAGSSVVGVYNGHTHRNKRTRSVIAPGVPFVEMAATKEYPGGYGLVRVFEGGYSVNFYKAKADPARAWSERSRGEYLNLYPYYTLGRLEDRNFVVTADFSDAARASGEGPAAAGGRGGRLPATGGGPAAAGAAALAAAAALRAASRSE